MKNNWPSGGPSQLHPGTKPSCDVRESPQIFFTRSDAGFSTSPPYCELYYFEASILSLNQSGYVRFALCSAQLAELAERSHSIVGVGYVCISYYHLFYDQ